jgi:hypothetical protein
VTEENVKKILNERDTKQLELETLKATTETQLWLNELETLKAEYTSSQTVQNTAAAIKVVKVKKVVKVIKKPVV